MRGSIRVGSSSALAGLEQGGISEGRVCNPILWNEEKKSRVRSRCCLRSLWDLSQELLLCDRNLTNLAASQIPRSFHGLVCIQTMLHFFFFFSFFFQNFYSLPKSKEQGGLGESSVPWMAGRLADAGRSSTVPLTFFQGLAVPLQGVGCMQAPVYSRIPKSCFVFSCLLLQSVPGSVGESSSWSFTGLEREGFGFFCLFFLSSPSKHGICWGFIPFLE